MILAIKTDNPVTELYLLDERGGVLGQDIWESGNQLSNELLTRIEQLLNAHQKDFTDIKGVIVYKGPGSFTGLRIGVTVANTIAYSNQIPVAGTATEEWLKKGVELLPQTEPGGQVLPEYGGEANITKPRK